MISFLLVHLFRLLLRRPLGLLVFAERYVASEPFEFACHLRRRQVRVLVLPEGLVEGQRRRTGVVRYTRQSYLGGSAGQWQSCCRTGGDHPEKLATADTCFWRFQDGVPISMLRELCPT